jgi:hypothetical protein
MLYPDKIEAEQRLLALAEQFEHWRAQRIKLSERIPSELWDQAVGLTQVLTNSYVAKQLRLSPGDLRRRSQVQAGAVAVAAPAGSIPFIELKGMGLSTSCPENSALSVEFERPDGARLRLRYAHSPLAINHLIQLFLTVS